MFQIIIPKIDCKNNSDVGVFKKNMYIIYIYIYGMGKLIVIVLQVPSTEIKSSQKTKMCYSS